MPLRILYPNGEVLAVIPFIDAGAGPVEWDGSVTISGPVTAVITNDGTFATPGRQDVGNASLAAIEATDFATQTTLALIKAKTDNIDVALSTRTKPTDSQNVKDAGYQNATWAVHHIPSANVQATITQASAGGSLKNVCLGLTGTLCSSSTTAPAAIQLTLNLIDGNTGGGTYLWRTVISLPATAGAVASFNISMPHGFEGTAATAMTIEFSAAGGANTIESVSMYGTTRL